MAFIAACLSGLTGCCRCDWCCCSCCHDMNDSVGEAMEPMATNTNNAILGASSTVVAASPTIANVAAPSPSPIKRRSVSFALKPVEPLNIEYKSPLPQPGSPTRGIMKKSSFSDVPDEYSVSKQNQKNCADLL